MNTMTADIVNNAKYIEPCGSRLTFGRGPVLPKEIVDVVLTHIPTNNKLIWEGKPEVYVDGLLPHAIYDVSSLLPYYGEEFSTKWTLRDIARQNVKQAVLEDESLTSNIKLRSRPDYNDFSALRPLMEYPHQWRKLVVPVQQFVMDDFMNVFRPCLSRVEELHVSAYSITSLGTVVPLEGRPCVKTAGLSLNTYSDFFNSGILNSITSLTVDNINAYHFLNHDAFKKALNDLPLVISRLPHLYELAAKYIDCDHTDLEGLPRVNSTSLHSLDFEFYTFDTAIAFLHLFANCRIDSVTIDASLLQDVERLFGDAKRICIGVSHKISMRNSSHYSSFSTFLIGLRSGCFASTEARWKFRFS